MQVYSSLVSDSSELPTFDDFLTDPSPRESVVMNRPLSFALFSLSLWLLGVFSAHLMHQYLLSSEFSLRFSPDLVSY